MRNLHIKLNYISLQFVWDAWKMETLLCFNNYISKNLNFLYLQKKEGLTLDEKDITFKILFTSIVNYSILTKDTKNMWKRKLVSCNYFN